MKKNQSYRVFFYRRQDKWNISTCTARNHTGGLIILCAGEKTQALSCFKHYLTFLALGLTVQNDGTSAISQDNGSRSVFKPDFSRERRMDLAPTHITLKRCNLKSQLVTLLLNWSSETGFQCPALASIFLAADLGVFICAISLK